MGPVLIRIGEKRDQIIYGNLWHASMEKPAAFTGIGQLILRIEELCDQEGLVPPEEEPRFLNDRMRRKYKAEQEARNPHPPASDLLSVLESQEWKEGKAKTLLVADIWSHKDYTMQGVVQGPLTGGKYVKFRSALELMRMIDLIEI